LILTFTKEVFENYNSADFGHIKDCNVYKTFDNEILVGEFLCSSKVAYILTKTDKLRIDIKNHFFKTSKYEIINLATDTKIGFYDLPIWRISWKEIGNLTLSDQTYYCNRQRAETKYNIFKKATWGHYKINLANQLTEINYKLKVDTNWISPADSEFRKAQGEIVSNQTNNILILAGLFLIERMLYNVDMAAT
jgi:hypothetical protein